MPEALTEPLAVLGSGSWGTALAIHFARTGKPTRLWGRDAAHQQAMRESRRNAQYLPDAAFPPRLDITTELESTLDGVTDVLIAVPSHGFRSMLERVKPCLREGMRVAWAT